MMVPRTMTSPSRHRTKGWTKTLNVAALEGAKPAKRLGSEGVWFSSWYWEGQLVIKVDACRTPSHPILPATITLRSYWIPGSYAPAWSEKRTPLLKAIEKDTFQRI